MKNKTIALIAVAVIAVAVAGAGIYYFYQEGDDGKEGTMILIQDDEGVYFWVEGNGETAIEALIDATEKYDIPFIPTGGEDTPNGIESLFGITMAKETIDEVDHWSWWSQYSCVDGAWVINDVGLGEILTSDVEAIAVVYSDGSTLPAVSPDKAKIWRFSTEGMVFTIESETGLNFKINGVGETAIDALIDATGKYKIPFDAVGGDSPFGIDSLFEISMAVEEIDGVEQWSWWIQKVRTSDGDGWESSADGMNEILVSDTREMKLVYGSELMV